MLIVCDNFQVSCLGYTGSPENILHVLINLPNRGRLSISCINSRSFFSSGNSTTIVSLMSRTVTFKGCFFCYLFDGDQTALVPTKTYQFVSF